VPHSFYVLEGRGSKEKLSNFIVLGFIEFEMISLPVFYEFLFSLSYFQFLVFDTQMIIGGKKRKIQMSPEEYIFGALQLYLDIVYIFMMILMLTGGSRD
jgi:FtsH-binding integral membrane protein